MFFRPKHNKKYIHETLYIPFVKIWKCNAKGMFNSTATVRYTIRYFIELTDVSNFMNPKSHTNEIWSKPYSKLVN